MIIETIIICMTILAITISILDFVNKRSYPKRNLFPAMPCQKCGKTVRPEESHYYEMDKDVLTKILCAHCCIDKYCKGEKE